MSSAIDILKQDPHYLDQRRKEMQPYIELFTKQLAHFIERMPLKGVLVDTVTGEMKTVYDKEWEEGIDRLKQRQQDYLKITFPEFYKTISHE